MSNKLQQAKLILAAGSPYLAGSIKLVKPIGTDATVVRAGATATRVNSAGLIETVAADVPRIDYLGGGCPSLLIELQRTNLALYSEQFDNAAWTKLTGTITPNASASPNGLITADLIVEPISDRAELTSNLITTTDGVTYTFSTYGKENPTSPKRFLAIGNSSISFGSSTFAVFDLALGIITFKSGPGFATIDIAENGFYRLTLTQQAAVSLPSSFFIYTSSVNNNVVSIGGGSVIAWGCQIEEGSTATSYIPTTTTAVTRNADVITVTVPSGVSEISTTFDDDTTQIVTSIPSTFTLPVGRIKSVVML